MHQDAEQKESRWDSVDVRIAPEYRGFSVVASIGTPSCSLSAMDLNCTVRFTCFLNAETSQ